MPRPRQGRRFLFEAIRLADHGRRPCVEYSNREFAGHRGSHHLARPRAGTLHNLLRGRRGRAGRTRQGRRIGRQDARQADQDSGRIVCMVRGSGREYGRAIEAAKALERASGAIMIKRRSFLKSLAAAAAAGLVRPRISEAALPKAKITRVRIYLPPNLNRTFNQSDMIVMVETDAGLTGIGEGGVKDTLEQCAGSIIGQNPFQIERLWQKMYIDWFYPPGREKVHAMGAIDLALWDIKGKALGLPVHEILGGAVRNYCECYPTTGLGGGGGRGGGGAGGPAGETAGAAAAGALRGGGGSGMSLKERARAVMEAGYRAFRVDAGIGPTGGPPIVNNVFNTHERVRAVAAACKEVREGVGNGDWAIDFHQKFDYADAVRCCRLIEEYEPYFVEDPVRDEHFHQDIPKLR